MKAADLDFNKISHFKTGEFPVIKTGAGVRSVLEFTDANTLRAINKFREKLGHGVSPSPLTAGWVREGGSQTSQHYIGPIHLDEDGEPQSQRLSTAGDLFPYCDIRQAFMVALGIPELGGIGIYLDTKGLKGTPQPMVHLDTRPGRRQIWMRYEGRYIYPERGGAEMDEFYRRLGEL